MIEFYKFTDDSHSVTRSALIEFIVIVVVFSQFLLCEVIGVGFMYL